MIKNMQTKSRRNEKRHSKPLPNLPPRVPSNKQLFATGFEITIGWIIKGATQNFVPYVPTNASLSSFSSLPHSLDGTDSWGYTNKQWKENFSSSLAEISSKKKGNRKKNIDFSSIIAAEKQRSTNNNTTQLPNPGWEPARFGGGKLWINYGSLKIIRLILVRWRASRLAKGCESAAEADFKRRRWTLPSQQPCLAAAGCWPMVEPISYRERKIPPIHASCELMEKQQPHGRQNNTPNLFRPSAPRLGVPGAQADSFGTEGTCIPFAPHPA